MKTNITYFMSSSTQSKCRISACLAPTTTPYAPTSARGSWRSWRRSSTSASTWQGLGAWRSPPHSNWTRRKWKFGSRTDAWSKRSASGREPPLTCARPPPPLVPGVASTRSRRTPTSRPCLRLQARHRVRRRSPCLRTSVWTCGVSPLWYFSASLRI